MNFVLTTNTNDEPVYGVEVNGMTIYNPVTVALQGLLKVYG